MVEEKQIAEDHKPIQNFTERFLACNKVMSNLDIIAKSLMYTV